jgi:hypothetical protein
MIKLKILILLFLYALKLSAEFDQFELWLIDRAHEVSALYNKPYKDQPEKKVKRVIHNKEYVVYRPNHGLAHGLRQALYVKDIVKELRDPLNTHNLALWVQKKSDEDFEKLTKKLALAALYYRVGRENEYSNSRGTEKMKARFEENMRNGAQLFKKAAQSLELFDNEEEIQDFMNAFYHYEYKNKKEEMPKKSKPIDRILYAAHILDVRRVAVSWNNISARPKRIKEIARLLGLSEEKIQILDNKVAKYLEATGDRDGWQERGRYAHRFMLQANDPEMMMRKIKVSILEDVSLLRKAKERADDPWYPYIKRPLLDDSFKDFKDRIIQEDTDHIPWTLKAPKKQEEARLIRLKDIVVDRIVDKKTGKKYIKFYHGTTSDFINIFKSGADAVKYNFADTTALGMGFYLTANINEAKNYACTRIRDRKDEHENLLGLLLVFGILESDKIQGKELKPSASGTRYSDDISGKPLDEDIFFVRNKKHYNQFLFFENIKPYLKLFKIITLPKGFGKAKNYEDLDGLSLDSTIPEEDRFLRCTY